ncbi:leukocyte surface antigen CD47-like [Lacerta agilis]|uniref:leukocyte surface antigen CD47-like n=1 Tax=Lacerta agilis TaxID=80427 RepID=UPI00141A4E03|nr:leukocyte surface antigen CD47-like [Lacerta agilis]
MWVLSVCWVLLGTLGAGSAHLDFEQIHSVSFDVCNTTDIVIPCRVTNLHKFGREEIFIKWKLNGKEFFTYDGYENRFYRNDTFLSVDLLDILKLTAGVASIKMSPKEAIPGNYTCIVVERNREGEHIIELRYGSGKLFVLFFSVIYQDWCF